MQSNLSKSLLTFHFIQSDTLELVQIDFYNPINNINNTFVRGRYSMPGAFSFQWTAGIAAFSILAINEAKASLNEESQFILSGGTGSAAVTLEYCICKQSAWVNDFFGVSARGQSNVFRFFRRSNPGRKRAGQVALCLNNNLISGSSISCVVNGKVVNGIQKLKRIASQIEKSWFFKDLNVSRRTEPK